MPLLDVQRRFRELGRIRLGEKNAKGHPTRLSDFRLTSPARDLLERAAECYGGRVASWTPAPGQPAQFELKTGVSALDVIVPPGEPISQWWEMWGPKQGVGVVCIRRCNGVALDDGQPCQCPSDLWERSDLAKDGRACKPTTRLSIMLPRLPDVGVWRMDTHGIIAAMELPGTADALAQAAARRIWVEATLRIEQRTIIRQDRKATVPVPVLAINEPLLQLMSRDAGLPVPPPAPIVAPRELPPLDAEPAPGVYRPDQFATEPERPEPLPAELAARGVQDTPPLPDAPAITPASHEDPLRGHGSASGGPAGHEHPGAPEEAPRTPRRPTTPDHWKQAAGRRKISQADLLKKARELADELGVRPPLALAGVTDDDLCDKLWAWLKNAGQPVKRS